MNPILIDEGAQFDAFLQGSPSRVIPGRGSGWPLVIGGYRAEPGERPEKPTARHILALWRGNVAIGERRNALGVYSPYRMEPGTMSFLPVGPIPASRPLNRFELIMCFLEPSLMSGVEQELDRRPAESLRYLAAFKDPAVRQLIAMLAQEAKQGGPSGRLYADHLAHALAIRILFLGTSVRPKSRREASALPRHLLQRVQERMHDLCNDLDLQTLAAETGYSRTHFLRMFQAATGFTPHHYLLRIRLKRAQELIKQGYAPLIDIAAACGFSSQAHMCRIFRQMLGVTPGEYRRASSPYCRAETLVLGGTEPV